MRSSRNCRATISEISGSSRMRMRGSISTCVTRDPNLAKHWASSQPIGPPPSTTSRGGSALKVHTVSEVRQPASASPGIGGTKRSEEHTSELQSHSDLVCRLLLEKKKKNKNRTPTQQTNYQHPTKPH